VDVKQTKDKKIIDLAERFQEIRDLQKELAKEEKELKAFFNAELKKRETGELQAGQVLVLQEQGANSYLDKERILADKGQAFVDKYTKKREYMKLKLKLIKKAA